MGPLPKIPDEFKVSKYDTCRTWKPADWARALFVRSAILRRWALVTEYDTGNSEESIMTRPVVRSAVLSLLEKPDSTLQFKAPNFLTERLIRDQTVSEFFSPIDLMQTVDSAQKYQNIGIPVCHETEVYGTWIAKYRESSTFRDYMSDPSLEEDSQEDHPECERRAIHNVIDSIRQSEKLINETPSWKIYHEANNSSGRFMISVDLCAPNADLVADFKRWLKETRKTAGIRPIRRKFSSRELAQWHGNRYLAFIDLYIWSRTHGKKLSHSDIGSVIFPGDESRDSESVRKTLSKNALNLLKDEIIACLNYQASR